MHLSPEIRHQVIRAFAIYFQLVNIAEQNHRIRRKRDYERSAGETVQPGSIESAVQELKEQGIAVDEVQEIIEGISLELVMTAHPTEATRRAVLDIHKRIADEVMELDNPTLTYREREKLREKLLNEVLTFGRQMSCATASRPSSMKCVTGCIISMRRCSKCFRTYMRSWSAAWTNIIRTSTGMCRLILRFGSWIGGDRDGNPSVTAKVTWETLTLQRELALQKYEELLKELMEQLSFSTNIVK